LAIHADLSILTALVAFTGFSTFATTQACLCQPRCQRRTANILFHISAIAADTNFTP
jgi:hypothetical protein